MSGYRPKSVNSRYGRYQIRKKETEFKTQAVVTKVRQGYRDRSKASLVIHWKAKVADQVAGYAETS